MLILDEPTNHLDVDAREALVQAMNAYEGAVVLVSHDRHMLELTADRLVLVDGGTATEYAGSIDDYTDMILGKSGSGSGNDVPGQPAKSNKKEDRKAAAQARAAAQVLKKAVRDAEADLATLEVVKTAIEKAMFDPRSADAEYAQLTMGELSQRHGKILAAIDAAEKRWVAAEAQLEAAG